ncbi:MAG: LysM peptidoglycan-binding domain-containing protein [Defluviitaleaceae bacterium]|nr:LysM peptidoglycan-binding domain-containing protein [Defluviitaleaceae bacterium]
MKDFTLPANIKQIGSIGDGLRIYMEDYVCTFLQQYAEGAGFEERIAFLVGRTMVIDSQQFLFIDGAIYGRYAEKFEGHLRFTEKSVEYAEEVMEEHFPGLEIVGWMQSQPSYGTYLNQHYAAYHLRQFRKAHQVMFVVDPLERLNAFYCANPVAMTPTERMAEIPGYFIYYEKNKNMHEYMLVNNSQEFSAKPPTLVELSPLEYAGEKETPLLDELFNPEEDKFEGRFAPGGPRPKDPAEYIKKREDAKAQKRGQTMEQKRAVNMLGGLCAVLFVVCFIMGVGLIRNQERIDSLEAQARQFTTALRNQTAFDVEHAPVFAEVPVVEAEPNIAVDLPAETPAATPDTPEAHDVLDPSPPPLPPAPEPPAPTESPIQPEPAPPVTEYVFDPHEESAIVAPIPETYTIQPGDSLLAISLYFFGDANMMYAILELNGLDDPDMIIAGRTISLPQR